jgi:hypothetical protein
MIFRRPNPARALRLSVAGALTIWTLTLTAGLVFAQPSGEQPAAAERAADVSLHETLVFKLYATHRGEPAATRARAAGRALEHALESGQTDVRLVANGDVRVVYAGDVPVVELFPDDASLAGNASIDVYAAKVAAQVRIALQAERKRSDIAGTVFSLSLVVFFGLIALYVLRKIGELAKRARETILEHPERITPVRFSRIEVIGAVPLRALLLAALLAARWVLQVGVVYLWLLLSLSRFELTRPLIHALTTSLLGPVTSLAQRLLSALPLAVLTLALAAVVYLVLRFLDLFFAGVARGHERAAWLPRDLIGPTSVVTRVALVLLALIFVGPALTGDPDSVLARLGNGVLLALALAVTPLLCSGVLGLVTIFSRRLHPGRHVEVGQHAGRVIGVGLLDVTLRDASGVDIRVPHLCALISPMRVLAHEPRLIVELWINPSASPANVLRLLLAAVSGQDPEAAVELLAIDADGACYRVSVNRREKHTASDLRVQLAEALAAEGVAWGRRGAGASA